MCLACYSKSKRARTVFVYRDAGKCSNCKEPIAAIESIAVIGKKP